MNSFNEMNDGGRDFFSGFLAFVGFFRSLMKTFGRFNVTERRRESFITFRIRPILVRCSIELVYCRTVMLILAYLTYILLYP